MEKYEIVGKMQQKKKHIKKAWMPTLSGEKTNLFAVTIFLAMEKTLPAGTAVPGSVFCRHPNEKLFTIIAFSTF